jgi:hypothetical protein
MSLRNFAKYLPDDIGSHDCCDVLKYSTKCLKWNETEIKFQNISLNSSLLEFRALLLEFDILSYTIKLIPIFVLIQTF